MKVAMLHMDPEPGAIEANRILVEELIRSVARLGATIILTPELCIPGYFFQDIVGSDWIMPQPDEWMTKIVALSWEFDILIFLSYPERDASSGKCYNTVFAIDKGRIAGKHRKIEVHPGAEEKWSSPGRETEPVRVSGKKIGILICADTLNTQHGVSLAKKDAELLIVNAAWGHRFPPMEYWKKLSIETDLPLWACNRTGIERNVDWTKGESTVIIGGQPVFSYAGDPAVLLFDWDLASMRPTSEQFEVIHLFGSKGINNGN
ncbi:carbon-nitrogen hydrolase family protein [Dehalogenimonas etheniformans]|uniref:Carbon-nitrogen hydrolase family protein n=1 Tax=Dehalogenimonas etheniformans TaxID=1536648 RepID=A0A2P5P7P0_9CHLR|nr:carbon-nitrogen hydrolase family protein [Dehalogenimonas etheniformans]PPD58312.1 carbon-nitrogen hydrolase family protein [Dehalogenimonas etheniformans]QNT75721.1 carbon-nitrogen hydrolase family protein [Dehalogenimonas etheniformans]